MRKVLLGLLLVAILLAGCRSTVYQYRVISGSDGSYMAQPCTTSGGGGLMPPVHSSAVLKVITTKKLTVGDCILSAGWSTDPVEIVDCGICK